MVERLPIPTITGPVSPCIFSAGNIYSTDPGMTSYVWNVSSGGVITSGLGTNSITVTWNSAGLQHVIVNYTDQSGCRARVPALFNVTVRPLPGPAGNITGPSSLCAGAKGLVYSVLPVTDAIAYGWTLPPGFSIVSGYGTDTITVDADSSASSGNTIVYATNLCGPGPPSPPFPVIVTIPPGGSAGPDGLTCQTTPFTVTQATASNYSSVHWYSNGQGILSGTTTLSPTYTPAQGETGQITLTLVITGNVPCSNDTSHMLLAIEPQVLVNAGNGLVTCGQTPVVISGSSASYYRSLFWTTSGSGVFNDPTILHPTYTPGTSDVNTGSVFLTLHATSAEPCEPDSSRVLLTISRPVSVYAGPDSSICQEQPVLLYKANASSYSAIRWSTTGDGRYNDPDIINPVYTPGNEDILHACRTGGRRARRTARDRDVTRRKPSGSTPPPSPSSSPSTTNASRCPSKIRIERARLVRLKSTGDGSTHLQRSSTRRTQPTGRSRVHGFVDTSRLVLSGPQRGVPREPVSPVSTKK